MQFYSDWAFVAEHFTPYVTYLHHPFWVTEGAIPVSLGERWGFRG